MAGWLGEGGKAAMDSGLGDPLRHVGSREWHLACNWKVFCDNYLVRLASSHGKVAG